MNENYFMLRADHANYIKYFIERQRIFFWYCIVYVIVRYGSYFGKLDMFYMRILKCVNIYVFIFLITKK